VLKPNIVIAGKKAGNRADVDEVTEKTVSVVKACVPAVVPASLSSPAASRTPRQGADAVHGRINENCLVETRIKNRAASLEIPQNGKAGASCCEMLERMSAEDESN